MISIAIPDSLFLDEDSLRGKTVKAGTIARSAAIFGVERIYIYRDVSKNHDRDFETAKTILEYAETPQYLRRRLIPKHPDLESVGVLPPLRTPHHTKVLPVEVGDVRDAALVLQNNELFADVGSRELARFTGRGQAGQRVTVCIESLKPLSVSACERPKGVYWGYEVRRAPTLARFLRSANFDLVILTSRLGDSVLQKWSELTERTRSAERILVCFGSPEAGVHKMLEQDRASSKDFPKAMVLNTFPFQQAETVRLEEAILGSLSLLNVALRL